MGDQAGDVLAAFAQRRELNREDAQAIEKVLAEPAGVDLFLQVAIGRGNDADIDPAGARVADTFQFLFLQNAQQLCLHASGTSAISSRNKVPPSASSKRPGLSFSAPVNAPLTCPKNSLSKRPSGTALQFNFTRVRSL